MIDDCEEQIVNAHRVLFMNLFYDTFPAVLVITLSPTERWMWNLNWEDIGETGQYLSLDN
jgi:hypothetical protein